MYYASSIADLVLWHVAVCNITIPLMVASMEWDGTKYWEDMLVASILGLMVLTSHAVPSVLAESSSVSPSTTIDSPHVVDTAIAVMDAIYVVYILVSTGEIQGKYI